MKEIGYILPQALDMEEAIIGALLVEPEAIDEVSEILTPVMFYKVKHGVIYNAIKELRKANEKIDILTVTEYLSKIGRLEEIGGPIVIAQLSLKVSVATHLESHALVVYEKFQRRELIRLSNKVLKESYDNSVDINDIRNTLKSAIESTEGINNGEIRHISEVGKEYSYSILEQSQNKKDRPVKTHINSLNMALPFYGLNGGDYIIIAARPSMGKTAVALDLCKNIVEPALFLSLEMSELRLYNRMVLGENCVDSFRLKNASLYDIEWENLAHVTSSLNRKDIYFDDKVFKLNEIVSTIKKAVRKFGIKVVFIDYIGLIRHNSGRNREQDVSQISAALKECAKVEDVAIIALSQLNRASENRIKPQLTDLRDSGSLEQDADVVMFIHREDYQKDDYIGEKYTELIIRKNRDGELKTIYLGRNDTLSKYWEIEKPAQITNSDVF